MENVEISSKNLYHSTNLDISPNKYINLCNFSYQESTKGLNENFYFKKCKFSPDNLCVLVTDSLNNARIFNLPQNLQTFTSDWNQSLLVNEGEIIYDFDWFPSMNSYNPKSCVFLTASKDHPVHLWDAYTGSLRASYCCQSSAFEPISPISVNFNPNGNLILCGLRNRIDFFEISRPQTGAFYSLDSKSNDNIFTGLFSCFSFSDQFSLSLLAVGSYNKSIGFYDLRESSFISMQNLEEYFNKLNIKIGGVTQVSFNGNWIYVGFRASDIIARFDMRNQNGAFQLYRREVNNQQKVNFCFDEKGEFLLSGDSNGFLSRWDLKTNSTKNEILESSSKEKISHLSIPGCDYNSTYNLLSLSTGSRHYYSKEKGSSKDDIKNYPSIGLYNISN